MNRKLNIVFMATPEFAIPALHELHKSDHRVLLVVTQPDRPRGRGRNVVPSPVKRTALELGYPLAQPESVTSTEFISRLKDLAPDLLVIAAFGQLLPQPLLTVPLLGAVNIHASLLPKYRGAAPIQWAIINREKKTGITMMFMDEGLDTGDIILCADTEIAPDETAETLHDRLSLLGAGLLPEVMDRFAFGTVSRIPQDQTQATYAPLLNKKDGRINWQQSMERIEAFVRGMNPWPGAFSFYQGKRVKILSVRLLIASHNVKPGTVVRSFPGELRIAARNGMLSVLKIQGASGKRLPISDYLRGNPIPIGTVFK